MESDARLVARALGLPSSASIVLCESLEAVGGLEGLCHSGSESMRAVIGVAPSRRLEAVLALLERLLEAPELPSRIEDARSVAAYFRPRLLSSPIETFWVMMLDARARPLGIARVGEGTLTACLVHPREVFAPALRSRAASVILIHNHPSGDPEPSEEDEALTARLSEAGLLLGIPVLDHVVVARGGFRSLGLAHERPSRPAPNRELHGPE